MRPRALLPLGWMRGAALVWVPGAAPRAEDTPDVAAASSSALEHKIPGPTWYAQALSRGPGGLNVTHFWSKDRKLRAMALLDAVGYA